MALLETLHQEYEAFRATHRVLYKRKGLLRVDDFTNGMRPRLERWFKWLSLDWEDKDYGREVLKDQATRAQSGERVSDEDLAVKIINRIKKDLAQGEEDLIHYPLSHAIEANTRSNEVDSNGPFIEAARTALEEDPRWSFISESDYNRAVEAAISEMARHATDHDAMF